jgi:hypothetical protein
LESNQTRWHDTLGKSAASAGTAGYYGLKIAGSSMLCDSARTMAQLGSVECSYPEHWISGMIGAFEFRYHSAIQIEA